MPILSQAIIKNLRRPRLTATKRNILDAAKQISTVGQTALSGVLGQLGYPPLQQNQSNVQAFTAPARGVVQGVIGGMQNAARLPFELAQEVNRAPNQSARVKNISGPLAQLLGTKQIIPPSIQGRQLVQQFGPAGGATAFGIGKVGQAESLAGLTQLGAALGRKLLTKTGQAGFVKLPGGGTHNLRMGGGAEPPIHQLSPEGQEFIRKLRDYNELVGKHLSGTGIGLSEVQGPSLDLPKLSPKVTTEVSKFLQKYFLK